KKFPTGLIWYRIVGNGQPPKEIAKTSERNLDDPSILATAVHQAFKAYPAKRYGLILWDHGGAWLSGFGGDTEDGTKEGEGMAVQSVANALRESVRALGLKGEKPLEFLTFDTCLMGGAEEVAAYEGIAKVYTANAEIDFGDGLDYTKTLTYLAENPTVSALEFAKNEVSFWDAHHAAAGGLDAFFRSHAVWDTTKTPKLGESMKALAKAIGDAKQEKAVARALYLSSPEYFAGSTDDSSVALRDLGNVLQSLKGGENQSVGSAAARVIEDINSARVGLSAGDLRKDQAGLHIFGGPVANLGDEHMEAYPILAGAWEKATGWRDGVLSKLKSAAPKAIDKVTATLANASSGTDKAATLTINSPSADTVYIEGLLMQDAPKGDDLVLGTIGHGFVGPGESRIRWNGQATYLVASPKNIPVTVQPWTFTQQGQAIRTPFMSVEGLLSAPEEEPMKAFALMNGDTGLATHIVLETDASSYVVMTLAELAGMGEVTFTPVLTTFNADKEDLGEVPSPTGVQVPASGQLQFRREPVPAGKYFILGYAEDFWGNGDFEAQGVELTRP
ncbi:MAG TPA: clostripain-related cysteine peptidase, partial [Polyangia bacterium]